MHTHAHLGTHIQRCKGKSEYKQDSDWNYENNRMEFLKIKVSFLKFKTYCMDLKANKKLQKKISVKGKT